MNARPPNGVFQPPARPLAEGSLRSGKRHRVFQMQGPHQIAREFLRPWQRAPATNRRHLRGGVVCSGAFNRRAWPSGGWCAMARDCALASPRNPGAPAAGSPARGRAGSGLPQRLCCLLAQRGGDLGMGTAPRRRGAAGRPRSGARRARGSRGRWGRWRSGRHAPAGGGCASGSRSRARWSRQAAPSGARRRGQAPPAWPAAQWGAARHPEAASSPAPGAQAGAIGRHRPGCIEMGHACNRSGRTSCQAPRPRATPSWIGKSLPFRPPPWRFRGNCKSILADMRVRRPRGPRHCVSRQPAAESAIRHAGEYGHDRHRNPSRPLREARCDPPGCPRG